MSKKEKKDMCTFVYWERFQQLFSKTKKIAAVILEKMFPVNLYLIVNGAILGRTAGIS
jgi:hypothetical protein